MPLQKKKMKLVIASVAGVLLVAVVSVAYFIATPRTSTDQSNEQPAVSDSVQKDTPDNTPADPETYSGQDTSIADRFNVQVPNGWRASVSTNSSFLAVMFARPSQIQSLVYDPQKNPAVDYDGIPAWGGLTEHYYIRALTAPSQNFNPANHAEVITNQFTFDDGTTGQKYLVTKHAQEAAKWGGLLKDNEWYGRVFVYEKDGKRIEAHLAFYPSTKIDEAFFEKVAQSIHL